MTTPDRSHPGQCPHVWQPRGVLGVSHEDSYTEECAQCGARCARDSKTGLIVNYDRRVDVHLPHDHKPEAAHAG
jgi:hypothetical protein